MAQYNFDMNAAIQAGYTPDQIQAFLAQQKSKGNNYQLTQTPQATPQQSQQPAQPKSNFIADMLPTAGAIVGGIGGALIPGLGETGIGEIGGSAAGSAAGEGLKELIEGQPISGQNIATQGVIGGIGGGIGKGIGLIVGKILPKIAGTADVLDNGSQFLKQGTRQIRVKPSIYGASKEQAINDTLDKYGVQGTAQQQYQQLAPTIQKIEGKINQLIQDNPNAGANMNDIKKSFMDSVESNIRTGDLTKQQAQNEIDGYTADLLKASKANQVDTTDPYELQRSILQSGIKTNENTMNDIINNGASANGRLFDQHLAGLDEERTALQDKLNALPPPPVKSTTPEGFITLAQLRNMKAIMNKDYGGVQKTIDNNGTLSPRQKVIQQAWGSLDDAVQNASPEMKALLKDESNIYNADRSLSAARSNPPTLRVMGTSIPAPVTQAARDITTNTLDAGGNVLAKTPTGVSPLMRQTAGQLLTRAFVPQNGQNSQNPQQNTQTNESQYQSNSDNNQNFLPSTPQEASNNNATINNSTSQSMPGGLPSYTTGTPPSATNPLQGWQLNGQPIDPATANLVYKIATYQLDPTKLASNFGKSSARERLISLASQYNPSYDASEFPVKQKLRNEFTSGTTGQNINSINTAIGHLYVLSQYSKALGNSNIVPLNTATNTVETAFGNPKVTNFNETANAVSGELAKVFKANGATDSEIAQFQKGLNSSMSPAQLQGTINTAIALMASRLNALQTQYEQGMGQPPDSPFLNAESQKILQSLGGNSDPNQLAPTPQQQLFAQ